METHRPEPPWPSRKVEFGISAFMSLFWTLLIVLSACGGDDDDGDDVDSPPPIQAPASADPVGRSSQLGVDYWGDPIYANWSTQIDPVTGQEARCMFGYVSH